MRKIIEKMKNLKEMLMKGLMYRNSGMTTKEMRKALREDYGQTGMIELLISVIVLLAVMIPVVVDVTANVSTNCNASVDACATGTTSTLLNLLPLGLAIVSIVLIFGMANKR